MPIHVFVTLLIAVILAAGFTLLFAQDLGWPVAILGASALAIRASLALRP